MNGLKFIRWVGSKATNGEGSFVSGRHFYIGSFYFSKCWTADDTSHPMKELLYRVILGHSEVDTHELQTQQVMGSITYAFRNLFFEI